MYRSVILLITSFILAQTATAQNSAPLLVADIGAMISQLHQSVRSEQNNEKRVEQISKAKSLIDVRINQVALDESIPFDGTGETVSKYYRLGDQINILGMLKADSPTKMNPASCNKALVELSASGINVTEDTNVLPAHLREVAKTVELICK